MNDFNELKKSEFLKKSESESQSVHMNMNMNMNMNSNGVAVAVAVAAAVGELYLHSLPDADADADSLGKTKTNSTVAGNHQKRFCGNRFSRWELGLAFLFVTLNVLLAILIPVAYLYLIPKLIQSTLDDLGQSNSNRIVLSTFSIGNFKDSSLLVGVDLGIPAVVPFPVRAGLGVTPVRVTDQQGNIIAETICPALDFWVDRLFLVSVSTNVTLSQDAQSNIENLLGQLAEGVPDLQVVVHLKAPITVYGWTIYSGLELYKTLDLGSLETNVESLVGLLDRIASSISPKSFQETGELLASKFSATDVISLAKSFSVVWTDLTIELNESGLSSEFEFALENGSPFQVTFVPGADFYLELQGTPIAHVIAHGLALQKGYQSLKIKVDVLFLDEKLEVTSFSNALERASHSYATTDDFVVSIVGPVTMPQASFIYYVTTKLRFDIPLSQLLALHIGGTFSVSNIMSTSGFESILGNSTISLQVDSKQITIPFGLALPAFAPIPHKFTFPYSTSLEVVGKSASLLNLLVDPVSISRSNIAISVNTSLSLTPVNSNQAALELADALNPILALKPTPGLIGIGNLVFSQDNQKTNFNWTRVLFGGRNISIHLPPLNKTLIFDTVLSASRNSGVSQALAHFVSIERLQITQLNSSPGFGVDGIVDAVYPPGAPHLNVDIGYFGVEATLGSSVLTSFKLPTGLAFNPQQQGTGINAEFVIDNKEPDIIAGKIQKIVDYFLIGTDFDGSQQYAGITGLQFGSSVSSFFVTFEKIIVDISLDDLEKIANSLGGVSLLLPSLPPNMPLATIESADIGVSSAHHANIALGVSISNPTKISIGVSTVGFKVELDHTTLLEFELAPISLSGQNEPQTLALDIKTSIHSSESGSAEKLGSLLTDFSLGNIGSKMRTGIGGLIFQRTGASSKIDVLSGVHFNVEVGNLIRLLGKTSSYKLVDISTIIPTTDQILSYTHQSIKYGMVDTSLGQGRMKVGADVEYQNVVPVSLKVPFCAVDVSLGGNSALVAQVSGVEIDRISGTIRPRIELSVKRDPGIADHIGSIIHQLMHGQPLDTSIQISKVYFGSGPLDENDLFSALSLDITNLVKPFLESGRITVEGLAKRDVSPWNFLMLEFANVKVERLDLVFSGDRDLKTSVGTTIGLPFPVDLNIPFISMNALVEDTLIVAPIFSLAAKGANPVLNLEVFSELYDSDDLADQVVQLTNTLINGGPSSQKFFIENLVLGASASDNIAAFSKVVIGVPADVVLKPAHEEIMKLLGGSLYDVLRSVDLSIGSVKIGVAPNRSVLLETSVSFQSKMALSLSGLHYIGLSIGLEGRELTNVELPGFSISPGLNKQDLSVKAVFPSSDSIQNEVERFANDLRSRFGKTGQVFQVRGLMFGSNPRNPIKFLNRAVFNISSARVFTQDTLDFFSKMIFPPTTVSLLDSVKLESAVIDLQPVKVINFGLAGSTTANFSVSISLPFVSLGSKLDSIDAFDVSLADFKIAAPGPFNLHSSIYVHDSDQLADGIAGLVDDLVTGRRIKGDIGAKRLIFGVSTGDYVDTFSKVSIQFELEGLLRPLLQQPFNITSLLDRLAVSLSGLDVKTAPARSLDISLFGRIQNGFSLSLSNLGFFGVSAGLDSPDPIIYFSGKAPNFSPGQNELALQTNVQFSSTSDSKKRVASLVHDIISKGLGSTKENITATGLLFGLSRDSSFKFLSKAVLSVASSSILTPKLKEDLMKFLDIGKDVKLIDLFSLSRAVVDGASNPQSVNLDIGLAIKYRGIRSSIQLGRLDADIILNEKLFLTSRLEHGIRIATGPANSTADVSGSVQFSNDISLQQDVNKIAQSVFTSQPLPGRIGVTNIIFGTEADPSNMIDIFSQISLAVSVDSVYTLAKVPLPLISDIVPVSLSLDVHDPVTLLVEWTLQVAKIPASVQINLPYLHLGTFLDRREFMDLTFSRFVVSDGRIDGRVFVKVSSEASVNQVLVGTISDLLFHRAGGTRYPHTLSLGVVSFGGSAVDAVRLFSQIEGRVEVEGYVHQAAAYFDDQKPAEFVDIAAQLVPYGLDIACLVKPLPFPIIVKLRAIEIDIGWQVGGVGRVYEALHVTLDSINLPAFHVRALPDLDPVNGGFEPLTDLLLNMFQFKEFVGNARFKRLVLVGSGGGRFVTFRDCLFAAPPSFYIPDPMFIEVLPFRRPLEIGISVRNPSSLHLDLGRAVINVVDADSRSVLLSADSRRDVVAYNVNQGGNGTTNQVPMIALLQVPVLNIGGAILELPKLILRLLTHSKEPTFDVDVHFSRGGADIGWVATATRYIVQHGLLGKLGGILGTILAHTKVSIGTGKRIVTGNGNGNGTGNGTGNLNDTQLESLMLMQIDPAVSAAVKVFWGEEGIPKSLKIRVNDKGNG